MYRSLRLTLNSKKHSPFNIRQPVLMIWVAELNLNGNNKICCITQTFIYAYMCASVIIGYFFYGKYKFYSEVTMDWSSSSRMAQWHGGSEVWFKVSKVRFHASERYEILLVVSFRAQRCENPPPSIKTTPLSCQIWTPEIKPTVRTPWHTRNFHINFSLKCWVFWINE